MTVLKGIPKLGFDANERFTPIGALKAVGVWRGDEVTYSLLMGVSGAAFRTTWSPDWALDMANFAPEDLVQNGAEWLGLKAESRLNDSLDDAWSLAKKSIERDVPILSCGLAGAPEFCIVAGFDTSPRRFHVRGYFEKAHEAYAPVDVRPWQGWNHLGFGKNPLVLLSEVSKPDQGRLLVRALGRALRFAKVGRLEASGRTHLFGGAAYDGWIESLRNLDPSGDLGLKAWAMAVNLSALADARRAAAQFLRILGAMKPDWSRPLSRAAEHYGHLVSVLGQAQPVIGYPLDTPARAAEKAAANLADAQRRELFERFLWSAKQEDAEALGWVDVALHGT